MLRDSGVKHIFAIEPSEKAFRVIQENTKHWKNEVTALNCLGEEWVSDTKLDYVFSIGVIDKIPNPGPVIDAAHKSLKVGGRLFLWVYSYEGNELYLRVFQPIRNFSHRLPHGVLRVLVELFYGVLFLYRFFGKVSPLPMREYIETVLWPMTPQKRRLVIYDQMNPAYSKYYKREEATELLESACFCDIDIHHRHRYSWSVIGTKCAAEPNTSSA